CDILSESAGALFRCDSGESARRGRFDPFNQRFGRGESVARVSLVERRRILVRFVRLHMAQVDPALLPMTLLVELLAKQGRDAPPDQLDAALPIVREAQGFDHLPPRSGYAPRLHKRTVVGVQ